MPAMRTRPEAIRKLMPEIDWIRVRVGVRVGVSVRVSSCPRSTAATHARGGRRGRASERVGTGHRAPGCRAGPWGPIDRAHSGSPQCGPGLPPGCGAGPVVVSPRARRRHRHPRRSPCSPAEHDLPGTLSARPGFEASGHTDVVESILEHVIARLDGDADRRRHGACHVRRLEVRVLRLLLRHLWQVEALTVVVRGDAVLVSVGRRRLGRDLLAGRARGRRGGLLRAQGPQPRRRRSGGGDSDHGSPHRSHRNELTN
eukprot:scaffold13334_cov57-Phaeocystis_antarctica.AAC.3